MAGAEPGAGPAHSPIERRSRRLRLSRGGAAGALPSLARLRFFAERIRDAASSRAEVPLLIEVADTVLRGSIDLLVERGREPPLIVDYKTDRVDGEETAELRGPLRDPAGDLRARRRRGARSRGGRARLRLPRAPRRSRSSPAGDRARSRPGEQRLESRDRPRQVQADQGRLRRRPKLASFVASSSSFSSFSPSPTASSSARAVGDQVAALAAELERLAQAGLARVEPVDDLLQPLHRHLVALGFLAHSGLLDLGADAAIGEAQFDALGGDRVGGAAHRLAASRPRPARSRARACARARGRAARPRPGAGPPGAAPFRRRRRGGGPARGRPSPGGAGSRAARRCRVRRRRGSRASSG